MNNDGSKSEVELEGERFWLIRALQVEQEKNLHRRRQVAGEVEDRLTFERRQKELALSADLHRWCALSLALGIPVEEVQRTEGVDFAGHV